MIEYTVRTVRASTIIVGDTILGEDNKPFVVQRVEITGTILHFINARAGSIGYACTEDGLVVLVTGEAEVWPQDMMILIVDGLDENNGEIKNEVAIREDVNSYRVLYKNGNISYLYEGCGSKINSYRPLALVDLDKLNAMQQAIAGLSPALCENVPYATESDVVSAAVELKQVDFDV